MNLNVFFRWLNLLSFLFIAGKRSLFYYKIIKNINKRSLLIDIENAHKYNDTIISGYELQKSKEYEEFYLSQLLKQSFANLKKTAFSSLVNTQKLRLNVITTFLCLIFFILYGFILTYNYTISLSRFINPEFRIRYTHKLVKIEISPENIKILEGSDVEISLLTHGKVKDVFLVMKSENNTIRERMSFLKMSNRSTNKLFVYDHSLKNIYDDFTYYGETIQTRDSIKIKTKEYKIKVVKEPIIKNLKLVFIYPYYTRIKPKVITDNGNIEAVERTLIKISGEANNNLNKAYLYYNNRKIKLSVSDQAFSGKFILYNSGKYSMKFKDINYNTNSKPVNYSVIVLKDNSPIVDIVKPGIDLTLQGVSIIPLEIYAQDDYSVYDLKLFYRIKKAFIRQESKWNKINFNIVKSQTVTYNYNWDITKFNFMPGDIIEYYAQVYDGYKPDKDHRTISKKYIIKFPTVDEMYAQVNKEQSYQLNTLENLLDKQKEVYSDTEKLIKDIENKKELSYINKKELQQLKENQEKIAESVNKLSDHIKQSENNIKNKNMFSMEVMKKMKAVQDLLNEVGTKHMKESIKMLNDALKNVKLSKMKRKVLSQKITQEKILKRLEKTINMLKDLKNKQKMESFKKVADDIIKKQTDLMNKTLEKKNKKGDHSLKQLQDKQEQLKKSFENLKEQMKLFEKELSKEKSNMKQGVSDLNKQMDKMDLEKDFNKSLKSMKKNELSNSIQQQKKIISKLNSMGDRMNEMKMKSQQMDIAKLLNVFDECIFNMISVSEKVELYKKKIEYKLNTLNNFYQIDEEQNGLYDIRNNNEIAEDLIFLERNVRWNRKKMENDSKEAIIISPDFFKKFEDLTQAVLSARNSLADNRSVNTAGHLNRALLYNNILVRELLKLKEDFKDQMQMQASQGMGDSLNQMANNQEKLNELTQRMQGQANQGGMLPETQSYIEELAFQQEMIKKNLENFLNNYDKAGQLLGDLNKAAKEMNEVKKKLMTGKIDQDVVKKQKEILKRLLNSEKSLYVKDKSKKRESDTAKLYKSEKPPELIKEKVDYKNKVYYYQHVNKYPLEYKKLIDDYFKVLNSIEDK